MKLFLTVFFMAFIFCGTKASAACAPRGFPANDYETVRFGSLDLLKKSNSVYAVVYSDADCAFNTLITLVFMQRAGLKLSRQPVLKSGYKDQTVVIFDKHNKVKKVIELGTSMDDVSEYTDRLWIRDHESERCPMATKFLAK